MQTAISRAHAALVDAETSQRGFLLTGRLPYLAPFETAQASISASFADLRRLTIDDPLQRQNVAELDGLVTTKLGELRRTIELYRRGETTAALAIVQTDVGKAATDDVRRVIEELQARADDLLEQRAARTRRKLDRAIWIDAGAALGLIVLGFILFSINLDIARREELERALVEALAFQEQLTGIVGHDLRNPLSAVAMTADLLERRGGLTSEQEGGIRRISSTAARMNRMVDQLLDLTRARVGGGIPIDRKEGTSLSNVTTSAVEELRSAHPEADVRLSLASDIRGVWDPDRMSQVVSNLVGNAILHGAGPVIVDLTGSDVAATLEVCNGGPAIPPDRLAHLFEALRPRSANDRTKQSQGLGLGLYIANQIVTAHGGRIDVFSADPEGTRIVVTIPLAGNQILHGASEALASSRRAPVAARRPVSRDRAIHRPG